MKRLIPAYALAWLCAIGCGGAADTNTQNANRATASPPASSPASQPARNANAPSQPTPVAAQGDVTGAYFAQGNLPAEFSEIDHLSLATIDENGAPAPLNGFIRPKRRSADDYKLVNPTLAGRDLSFTTAAVGGVSYSFKGAFERLDNFPENPPEADEVILRGTLTKLRDGKTVAESPVSFTYEAGG
jgi:hypothetical protein